ncbi:divergent polysaccharide deacetylase family protein [Roseicitreum antarcticum]|nr:divergent polysaccharide deacetylase family protein [Roseicitreum antarcticum]
MGRPEMGRPEMGRPADIALSPTQGGGNSTSDAPGRDERAADAPDRDAAATTDVAPDTPADLAGPQDSAPAPQGDSVDPRTGFTLQGILPPSGAPGPADAGGGTGATGSDAGPASADATASPDLAAPDTPSAASMGAGISASDRAGDATLEPQPQATAPAEGASAAPPSPPAFDPGAGARGVAPEGDMPPRIGVPETASRIGGPQIADSGGPQAIPQPGLTAPDLPALNTEAPALQPAEAPQESAAEGSAGGAPDPSQAADTAQDLVGQSLPDAAAAPQQDAAGQSTDNVGADAPVAGIQTDAGPPPTGEAPNDEVLADDAPAAPTTADTTNPATTGIFFPDTGTAEPAPADEVTDAPTADNPSDTAPASDSAALPPQPGFTPFDGVRTNRLPSITEDAPASDFGGSGAAGAGGSGSVAGAGAAPADDAFDLSLPAYLRYAIPFENPDQLPLMAIVLLDDGLPAAIRDLIADLPFPLTMAVDPTLPDADAIAQAYRDGGKEVVALATAIPARATAADIDVTLGSHLGALTQATAVMDLPRAGFQGNRNLSQLIVPVLAQDGHGLITFDRGLNAAAQVAQSAGLAQVRVFRDLDDESPNPFVLRRYLDRAVFEAARDGRVVVMGRAAHAPTLEAIISWRMEGRASDVALAPVSATLRGE